MIAEIEIRSANVLKISGFSPEIGARKSGQMAYKPGFVPHAITAQFDDYSSS